MKLKILTFFFLLTLLLPPASLYSHEGENHGEKNALEKPLNPSSTGHIALKGRLFEGVLVICHKSPLVLYVSDSATNKPITDAKVEVEFKEASSFKREGTAMAKPGVYHIPASFKEGIKVHMALKITTPDVSEKLSCDIPQWPASSNSCEGEDA